VEVLNFAAEDVGAVVGGFGFHQVTLEKKSVAISK
jgi:hypothetical protein